MAFCLKPEQPISDEVKRIVVSECERAVSELRSIGTPHDDAAIHKARRRVKKIRAVIRLVRPSLGEEFQPLNRRLRHSIRLLAPVADGQGVVQALDRLALRYRDDFTATALATIRTGLIEREARADRQAKVDKVLDTVAATLRAERERVKRWRLEVGAGFRTIAHGLETSFARAKKAMTAAREHPTADHYHVWRRRVKDHWFHLRLIEVRCGNRLLGYERRLAALDECLGEYHNFALLRSILRADLFVARQETARRLRVIRRYQAELRRQAQAIAGRLYAEQPDQFVRRAHALWRLASVVGPRRGDEAR